MHTENFHAIPLKTELLLATYRENNQVENRYTAAVPSGKEKAPLSIPGAEMTATLHSTPSPHSDACDLQLRYEMVKGSTPRIAGGIAFQLKDWSTDHYLVMPAAIYRGNRFRSKKIPYSPVPPKENLGPNAEPIITDIPRLAVGEGPSRIHLLSTDMATPSVGIFFPSLKKGLWIFLPIETPHGYPGVEFEESLDRRSATLSILVPGVRGHLKLEDKNVPDRPATLRAGDSLALEVRIHAFDCPTIPALFRRFLEIRTSFLPRGGKGHAIPFSAAWSIHEAKYNRENWSETAGLYATSLTDEKTPNEWSLGWCGGHLVTHPLLVAGGELSRKRCTMNYDALFTYLQRPSGLFYEMFGKGRRLANHLERNPKLDYVKGWSFMRRQGDVLYLLLKQFDALGRLTPPIAVKPLWKEGLRRQADALVKIWRKNKQFGQWVDGDTLEVVWGGTVCGSIIPAGLALASIFFEDKKYLRVAKAAAEKYYQDFVTQGYTNGGPGDILQAPDSESAFGLLESFMVLYETTREKKWLAYAEDMAAQCSSWVVSYDFAFPKHTSFARLGMETTGTVWANVQNRHSAPGICTLSGDSLFKLYRATGNTLYLDLIRDIAHAIPQYLSREDRPIPNLEPGWMNERVNISDWENWLGRGEVFRSSCWCEVSNMLTFVEIPGLYLQPDTGLICAIDHIRAEVVSRSEEGVVLSLENPTPFDAAVNLWIEHSSERAIPLGQNALRQAPVLRIPARQKVKTRPLRSRQAIREENQRILDGIRRDLATWTIAAPLGIPHGGDDWRAHPYDAPTAIPPIVPPSARAGYTLPPLQAVTVPSGESITIDLEKILGSRPTLGQGIAMGSFQLLCDGLLTLSYDADWRAVLWLDGKEICATRNGNLGEVGAMRHRVVVPLKEGRHILAARVIAGNLGWKWILNLEEWKTDLVLRA